MLLLLCVLYIHHCTSNFESVNWYGYQQLVVCLYYCGFVTVNLLLLLLLPFHILSHSLQAVINRFFITMVLLSLSCVLPHILQGLLAVCKHTNHYHMQMVIFCTDTYPCQDLVAFFMTWLTQGFHIGYNKSLTALKSARRNYMVLIFTLKLLKITLTQKFITFV